jgi:hypothetical protein
MNRAEALCKRNKILASKYKSLNFHISFGEGGYIMIE